MRGDSTLDEIIERLALLHERLCPRQVLGARIGLLGGQLLGLALPQAAADKRLLTFVETDGCFSDGVGVATGCSVGHRTMRVEDQGKVGATFVDLDSGQSVRVSPRRGAREAALAYAPAGLASRWLAQREGYQRMPVDELLQSNDVQLASSTADIVGQRGLRVPCLACGEEIINGREVSVLLLGGPYCVSCAGLGYLRKPERTNSSASAAA